MIERPQWHERGACVGRHRLFFPELARYTEESKALIREICATCPVSAECAEAGVGQEYGVWAGDIREGPWDDD